MKFALLTDLHLVVPGQTAYGLDPLQRLHLALDAIGKVAPDVDRLIILGDLTDGAEPEAYAALIDAVSMINVPVTYLLGNHDSREAARVALPPETFDTNGYAQSSISCDFASFLFLDTVLPGSHAGSYCKERMAWLRDRLAANAHRDIYVFTHHPPADAGTDIDHLKLDPDCGLVDLLRSHGRVRHIFCGHVHRTITGSIEGLAWTALHGTNQQMNLFYRRREDRLQDGPLQVAFAHFQPGRHTLAFHDALERHRIVHPSAIGTVPEKPVPSHVSDPSRFACHTTNPS